MCLVHLFDSWYSLSLALPHSKYFLYGRTRIPRSTRRPSPSRRLPGLMCHADMTGHELSARETTPEAGKHLLCATNHRYSCLRNAGAFHEVSTSYFNTGKILDSDNSQHVSVQVAEGMFVIWQIHSTVNGFLLRTHQVNTRLGSSGGHVHIWASENNTS